MKIPEIRIKYSVFLEPDFQYHDKVKVFQDEWKKYEETILIALQLKLGVEFKQNIIDVYISSGKQSFSDPVTISHKFEPDEFVDVLTHELIHRLVTDNTWGDLILTRKLYWDEPRLTRNHVLVHALSQYVYLDILKEPHRLGRDVLKSSYPDYVKSWQLVAEQGYQNIIKSYSFN